VRAGSPDDQRPLGKVIGEIRACPCAGCGQPLKRALVVPRYDGDRRMHASRDCSPGSPSFEAHSPGVRQPSHDADWQRPAVTRGAPEGCDGHSGIPAELSDRRYLDVRRFSHEICAGPQAQMQARDPQPGSGEVRRNHGG
jgi:hypothetical protein